MMLLNPKAYVTDYQDPCFRDLVEKTIEFFETKGLEQIKKDDQSMVWYDDFLTFVREEKIFATLLTPARYGEGDKRWDMRRLAEYNEILGFYGLCYWYAWQVTILGLGPVWMGDNEALKKRTARLLDEGGLFGFGLSEKAHGADLYSTEMTVSPVEGSHYVANGSKYYIGNGNCAALISTFGKMADTGEYVFFAVDPVRPQYECLKKIDTSGVRQAYVAEYALKDYPITQADIISSGQDAWNASLNTINIGKFELGCASIGICSHAFHEALNHASSRCLYNRFVTDFPHVRRIFSEAYSRLVAMKLFTWRTVDYLRVASDDDRRYLLFNPVVKMKVTGQGEKVINLLHEVIAARGYEQDTYFEMAIRDIGMLPKLEGTEHVNMALIIKFIRKYFFDPVDYPVVTSSTDSSDNYYLFQQKTGGLAKIAFPDYRRAYSSVSSANTAIFRKQIELFRSLLINVPPSAEQQNNIDYMLGAGELFTLVVYAQLILENSEICALDPDLLEQIFSFLVKDFSAQALQMRLSFKNSKKQDEYFSSMLERPVIDEKQQTRLWDKHIIALKDRYKMSV